MSEDIESLREQIRDLEHKLEIAMRSGRIRRRSSRTVCGIPLWEVALGPDLERGESRGHAHAIVAIGDLATGVVALGGAARGVLAVGGLAVGVFSFGGCSIGLLLALGGAALGTVALGGGAVGIIAIGGGAVGYYACGGGALGKYVLDATTRSPEAVELFKNILKLPIPR
jgi:hypothetical protein